MTASGSGAQQRRLTPRGEATRARIVEAAAELMIRRGVSATTLDDVRAMSATSKSQLYHHFADKEALIHAVVAQRGAEVLDLNTRALARLNSIRGLELWRDEVLQRVTIRGGAYGCDLGSLAAELSDVDEEARVMLARLFATWEQLFADGFQRMKERGILRPDADPARLATAMIAALQGGYLLAQTQHAPQPMHDAMEMALQYVRSFELDPLVQ